MAENRPPDRPDAGPKTTGHTRRKIDITESEKQQYFAFRSWLIDEIRRQRMSQTELAEKIDVSRQAVARWLAAPDSPSFRRIPYNVVLEIADALNVDPNIPLDILGMLPENIASRTRLQRDAVSLIQYLSDDVLSFLLPIMRTLARAEVREEIRAEIRTLVKSGQMRGLAVEPVADKATVVDLFSRSTNGDPAPDRPRPSKE